MRWSPQQDLEKQFRAPTFAPFADLSGLATQAGTSVDLTWHRLENVFNAPLHSAVLVTIPGPESITGSTECCNYLPVAQKTYLFGELYVETIMRNPKKVGLFGYRYSLAKTPLFCTLRQAHSGLGPLNRRPSSEGLRWRSRLC